MTTDALTKFARWPIVHVVAVALLITGLNSLKPAVCDDPSYLDHARRIAAHPLDPYGGTTVYAYQVVPAIENVSPPVLPSWLAAGMAVVGDCVWALKLWMSPFALLLGSSVWSLAKQMTPGHTAAVFWMVMTGAPVLASFNLMQDLPAQSLAMAALAVLLNTRSGAAGGLRSWRLQDWMTVVGTGLLAGLALETKYTMLALPFTLTVVAAVAGRWRQGLVSAAVAVVMFVIWEAWVHHRYGTSQFLFTVLSRHPGGGGNHALLMIKDLLRTGGVVAPALVPLGAMALGAGRRMVLGLTLLVGVCLLPLGGLDNAQMFPVVWRTGVRLSLWDVTAGWIGPVIIGLTVAAVVPWFRVSIGDRLTWCLIVWLAIEIGSCIVLSPYGAVRRLPITVAVLTLLLARLAERRMNASVSESLAFAPVFVLSLIVGGLFIVTELVDTQIALLAGKRVQMLSKTDPKSNPIFFIARSWGELADQGRRLGFTPVQPHQTVRQAGDWLIYTSPQDLKEADPGLALAQEDGRLQLVEAVSTRHWLPWTTRPNFYNGAIPLRERSSAAAPAASGYIVRARVAIDLSASTNPTP